MSRAFRLVLSAVLAAVLVAPSSAPGAPSAAELERQLRDLKAETKRAGDAFSKAYWKLDESEVRVSRIDKRMKKTNAELAEARQRLNSHAASVYRKDNLEAVEFLLGAATFEEFATRMDALERIGTYDANAVSDIERLQAELKAERAELTAEQKQRAKELSRLKKERDKLQARLKSLEARFRKVKGQLDSARHGGRPGGVVSMPGPNGMVFPVVGSYYYADTWGASRSGGRRRHKGTDIMAPRGTPCVAVLSGTVTTKTNSLGGKTTWLRASNGWEFYYAHLDSWTVRSGRVKAGQIIGYVGSTGNASASAPHLHFEIHPGGGAAVNPYPYLRRME